MRSTNIKTRQRNYMIQQLDALARARCFDRDSYKCVRCGTEQGATRRLKIKVDLNGLLVGMRIGAGEKL